MAITNADGSIILTTKVDTKGINSGFNTIKGKAISLVGTLSKLGGVLAGVFSVTTLVNFSKEASNLAIEQEANVMRLIDIYGEASNAVGDFIDQNARALGMSKASATAFSSVYGNLFSVWADQATNAELTNRYLNMTAVIASKTGRTVEDVQERIRSGLLGNTEAVEDLGVFVNVKTIEITEAFQRIADGRSWEQLTAYEQSQVRTLAILEQSTKKYGDQVADTTALTRSRFLASYQDMQATWGQFVNVVLVPALKVVTKIMDIITAGMRAIAGLSGKTLESTESVSSSIGSSVDNQEDLTDAVKGTNKELKKSLAGFDELNTLSQDTGSGAGDGGASAVGGGVGIGDLSGGFGNTDYISEIDEELAKSLKIAGYALLVIGLILLGTGNFMLGAGFIVAGAGLVAITTASFSGEEATEKIKEELTKGFVIAGVIAIILGIILCVAGIFPQGIGLIVAGAASLVTAVAINWNAIKEKIDNVLSNEELTKKFLVIGLILLFAPAFWQIAIPLIVLGVAGMVKQEKLDFNKIKEKIKTVFKEIGDWIKIFGTLVLGVMLCLTGVGLPIGIALILSGAGHLVDKVSLYWDKYGEKIKEFFNSVLSWVKTWGLLVLGIILIISGVGFPLGLALLYKGAKNLTEAKDPNWFALLDKIKEVWKAIKEYWKTNIAKYFTSAWWGNLAKNAINGFLKWIVSGLNKLVDKINSFGFALPDVLGGGRVGFNVPKLSVPQLARGAVLPPNKPFLAMVGDQRNGTNIEAPLDTIVQAFNMALQNNGGGGFNGRIEVPVIIDGKQIALAVREAESNLGKQTVFGGFANAY